MIPGVPAGFEAPALESTIESRAGKAGVELSAAALAALAGHARAVMRDNPVLHLTTVTEPAEFVERHIGESLEGAARVDARLDGRLVDLGSGNGYPGLALAVARPGLRAALVEASQRKAEFLRGLASVETMPAFDVTARQVQRASDLADLGRVTLVTARAVGNWERLLPKLAPCLAPDGRVLLWAGATVETIAARASWSRLTLVNRHPLPGRDRSWIWIFTRSK